MGVIYSDLTDYIKKLEAVEGDHSAFFEKAIKRQAARFLGAVIPLTPVGEYAAHTGKVGGTLRRGWVAKTEAEAEQNAGKIPSLSVQQSYVDALPVTSAMGRYRLKIANPVHYGIYVDKGHRLVRNGVQIGYVPGVHMQKVAENTVQATINNSMGQLLNAYLKTLK